MSDNQEIADTPREIMFQKINTSVLDIGIHIDKMEFIESTQKIYGVKYGYEKEHTYRLPK